jgi:hypothetical protein
MEIGPTHFPPMQNHEAGKEKKNKIESLQSPADFFIYTNPI